MSKTLSIKDAQAANINVIEGHKGDQAVHDLITAYRANRRSGTACTKTRGEVKGSNKKLWKQKGTGRARAGTTKNPVWRGGGIVFGPRPRDYSKTVNKNVRRLALRKVLGDLIAAENVISVDSFSIADGKTKSFVAAVKGYSEARNVVVVAEKFDDKTYLAGRNVPNVLLITASEMNIEQLLRADTVIIVEDAYETLARRTA
ncbi:50S ribosomal protein L4 [Verrucomicrobiaceae bacterium R5-34]|uniref:Large ribosomal subunit protein uL4 n=1 Tax=Oceaniferula flava TaxID=2800421 RepID=A0AAE2SDA8_9BACT|nr:50S ribosomal protein L4 [Oceaniferula flavus]MBK1831801.1 50S ribosomal protein L4 [Verrucomicrobiaceae bacterium R5-34]MBK1856126.1 50S ribosomal protein L4 [Oceaniferula flavus]MBM1137433.1 50S ribosomal protein L4 [Oceaniferula flavus]